MFPQGLDEAIDLEVEEARRLGIRVVLTRGSMSLSKEDGGLPPREVVQREDRTSVFAQYTVRVANRAQVQDRLKAAGIPTAVHYPIPLNRQPAYLELCSTPTPVADQLAAEVMSLPMSADLPPAQQDAVVQALQAALA